MPCKESNCGPQFIPQRKMLSSYFRSTARNQASSRRAHEMQTARDVTYVARADDSAPSHQCGCGNKNWSLYFMTRQRDLGAGLAGKYLEAVARVRRLSSLVAVGMKADALQAKATTIAALTMVLGAMVSSFAVCLGYVVAKSSLKREAAEDESPPRKAAESLLRPPCGSKS